MAIVDLQKQCDFLLTEIEEGYRKADFMRKRIAECKIEEQIESLDDEVYLDDDQEMEEVNESLDDEFESEVEYYLSDYRDLDEDFTINDLMEILPNKKNYHYQPIMLRLIAETVKEIKELEEIIIDSEDSSEFSSLLELEKKKQQALLTVYNSNEESISLEGETNQIILAPTTYGSIRSLEEIDHIPREFYPGFLELINSIIDGTFKGVKRFTNNRSLNGVSEVRGFKTRILFSRVGKRKYAIISIFVKKCNNDGLYQKSVKRKVGDYRKVERFVEEQVKSENEEFLSMNDENVELLFSKLSVDEDKKGRVLCN